MKYGPARCLLRPLGPLGVKPAGRVHAGPAHWSTLRSQFFKIPVNALGFARALAGELTQARRVAGTMRKKIP